MRLLLFIITAAISACVSWGARADGDRFPNRADLHVAYCLELSKEQLAVALSARQQEEHMHDAKINEAARVWVQGLRSKIQRLQGYLVPRWMASPNLGGAEQIAAAITQARRDNEAVNQAIQSSQDPFSECNVNRCIGVPTQQYQSCVENQCYSLATEVDKHLWRCLQIESELPY